MSTEPDRTHQKPPFLKRVRIRNYKSIKFCDVELEPLTVLVGRNGSGKSNFVDALAFLRDVVGKGVRDAVKLHGGRDAVLCQFANSSFVTLEVEAGSQADDGERWTAALLVELSLPLKDAPRVVRERLRFGNAEMVRQTGYTAEGGQVSWEGDSLAHPTSEWLNQDRLLLGMYAGSPFSEFHRRLVAIGTHNFNPETLRHPRKPTPSAFLERDGGNIASVIETTQEVDDWAVARVKQYLAVIAETVGFAEVIRVGGYETLRFRRSVGTNGHAAQMDLPAASMSDGTLRAFAALVAVFQQTSQGPPSLVAIEEPETSLHPAASAALVDALDEATGRTQVLITTHSTELLDNDTIRPDNIRVVEMIDGETVVARVDEATVEIVERRLDTLGGLELQNQLHANYDDLRRQKILQEEGR